MGEGLVASSDFLFVGQPAVALPVQLSERQGLLFDLPPAYPFLAGPTEVGLATTEGVVLVLGLGLIALHHLLADLPQVHLLLLPPPHFPRVLGWHKFYRCCA